MPRKRRGYGEGSIFVRGDGLWVASISLGYGVDGRHRRKTVYGRTKQETLNKLRKLQTKVDAGEAFDAGTLTVSALLQRWLETAKRTLCRGTWTAYSRNVRDLIEPNVGGVRLGKLNALHVEGMLNALAAEGRSTAQQLHAGSTLRVALSWAVRGKLVATNPAKLVKMPAYTAKSVRPLEKHEINVFLDAAAPDRLYALYPLAIDSSCRQGELLGLVWADVNFESGTITIARSLEQVGKHLAVKGPKTKKSRRTVALSAFTLDALREHRKAMLAEGSYGLDRPVFCGARCKSWLRKENLLRGSFQRILKRARLCFRFHDLRHTCASVLLAGGTDVKTVQERLGHSTAGVTLGTYAHVMVGSQAQAAVRMNAIFSKAGSASETA
jgi:integrase